MDPSSELTIQILSTLLPPGMVNFVNQHVLDPQSPFQIYKRRLLLHAWRIFEALTPHVQPLIDRLLTVMSENQGLVGLAVSLAVVTVTLVILNWVRRIIMWWTRLTIKISFLFVLLGLGAWVWERGVFETAEALFVIGGKIVGYLTVVKNVWMDEYSRYEQQQQQQVMSSARIGRSGR